MSRSLSLPLALALVATAAILPAQKVALTDGSDRQVVVLDVADLLPENRGIVLPPKPGAGRFAAAETTSLQRLAAFVRTFVPAVAEPGADLQALGDKHLVVLGSSVQVAAAQHWLTKVRETLGREFQVDVRLCEVSAEVFAHDVAGIFAVPGSDDTARQRTGVVDGEASRKLLRTIQKVGSTRITQFPQVVAPSLHRAKLMVGKHVEYVRDFEVEVAKAAGGLSPVKETVFDGHDVEVMLARVGDGAIAVQLHLVDQVVQQPIPEVTTTVPGSTEVVTVQAPRVIGCRCSITVELASDETAVMAARKPDGSWLITMMTLYEITTSVPVPSRR